jgi:hypothetical protein
MSGEQQEEKLGEADGKITRQEACCASGS